MMIWAWLNTPLETMSKAKQIVQDAVEGEQPFDARKYFLKGKRKPRCKHKWQTIRSYGATVGYDARCELCGEEATFTPRD